VISVLCDTVCCTQWCRLIHTRTIDGMQSADCFVWSVVYSNINGLTGPKNVIKCSKLRYVHRIVLHLLCRCLSLCVLNDRFLVCSDCARRDFMNNSWGILNASFLLLAVHPSGTKYDKLRSQTAVAAEATAIDQASPLRYAHTNKWQALWERYSKLSCFGFCPLPRSRSICHCCYCGK